MEEKLDIKNFHVLLTNAFLIYTKTDYSIFSGYPFPIDIIQDVRVDTLIKLEPLIIFLKNFNNIIHTMIELNIGGDFKLDNIGFRMGTNDWVLSDFIIHSSSNKFTPITWDKWKTEASKEGPITMFTNGLLRLKYWWDNARKSGGRLSRTRKKRNIKSHR